MSFNLNNGIPERDLPVKSPSGAAMLRYVENGKSYSGALNDVVGPIDDRINVLEISQADGVPGVANYSDIATLFPSPTAGQQVDVLTDPDTAKVGRWGYIGGSWVKSADRVTGLEAIAAGPRIAALEAASAAHITEPDFSVADEAGNTALELTNGVLRVHAVAAETLELADPASIGLPFLHISPYVLSVVDEQGNAILTLDEGGEVAANSFALSDGTTVAGGGLDAMFHPSPFAQIDVLATMGQSNACGGIPTIPAVSNTQPYNNLMPAYTTPGSPEAGVAGTGPYAFTPLLAPLSRQEWSGIAAANQVSRMILRDSNIVAEQLRTAIYSFNSAAQGSGIPYLGTDGTAVNFKRDLLFGYNEATRLGLSYNVKAVIFSQGEADASMPASEYLAKEIQMYQWLNDFAKTTTGQANDIKLLTWQLHELGGPRVAQLIAADRHPNIHVCFPSYACTHTVGNGGHLNAVGMALSGAYYGVAYKRLIVDAADWEPLRPAAINVRGRIVSVKFNRPGLVFDVERFPEQAGGGFYASDSSGALSVISRSISDVGTVSVEFNRDFSGAVTFGYGVPMVGRTDGFTGYGGNLRDCDGLTETANIGGVDYPLHNWALLFKEVI